MSTFAAKLVGIILIFLLGSSDVSNFAHSQEISNVIENWKSARRDFFENHHSSYESTVNVGEKHIKSNKICYSKGKVRVVHFINANGNEFVYSENEDYLFSASKKTGHWVVNEILLYDKQTDRFDLELLRKGDGEDSISRLNQELAGVPWLQGSFGVPLELILTENNWPSVRKEAKVDAILGEISVFSLASEKDGIHIDVKMETVDQLYSCPKVFEFASPNYVFRLTNTFEMTNDRIKNVSSELNMTLPSPLSARSVARDLNADEIRSCVSLSTLSGLGLPEPKQLKASLSLWSYRYYLAGIGICCLVGSVFWWARRKKKLI